MSDKRGMGEDPLAIQREQIKEGAGLSKKTVSKQSDKTVSSQRDKGIKSQKGKSTWGGLQDDTPRQKLTVYIAPEVMERLKNYAFVNRKKVSHITNEILADFLRDKKIKIALG